MTDDLFELAAPVNEQDGGEAGPAHMQPPMPVSSLAKHFAFSVDAFLRADEFSREETLLMGGIRTLYWLALGQGDTALACEIAEWWFEYAPLHGMEEVIQ